MNSLLSVQSVIDLIQSHKSLLLAGDEKVLSQLPKGNWIGGTIPYFMSEEGGLNSQEFIYVTELPSIASNIQIQLYDDKSIHTIYEDLKGNSCGIAILPAFSEVHSIFSLNAPHFEKFALSPIIGWVSGFSLSQLDPQAKVFDGQTAKAYSDKAVVMQFSLPIGKTLELGIINLFHADEGDEIQFESTGFSASEAIVNGEKVSFADYCRSKNLDTKRPLITDCNGAQLNTSFRSMDKETVYFYAPVFKGFTYRHASDIGDYASTFALNSNIDGSKLFFSCNCILNYLHGELEGKKTGNITGPITFGEIAYQLLNQTLAYARIIDG